MIAWVALALADVVVEPAPAEGVASTVKVTDAAGNPRRGETVRVVHRPGTAHARERAIGITDGRGLVTWTPEEGGVARLRAGDQEAMLAIPWASVPAGTATLLGVLGLVAAGVFASGFVRQGRSGRLGRAR